tara:strand:+ start:2600 stop:3493 length:894 start_codon:yes stop_codon:yes gene_type:complete
MNNKNKNDDDKKKGQDKGLKRNVIDKYYTKPEITILCYDEIKKYLEIDFDNDLIIEPSAGDGSFMSIIEKLCKNVKYYDIDPPKECNTIIKQDFLKINVSDKGNSLDNGNNFNKYNKIHIIGNPPFGRQSSTAIKFIRKSTEFCNSISFILPKSFKKDSLKDKIPLNFHCVYEGDVPDNSFLINKIEHNVPCIFQIWEKSDNLREKSIKMEPKGYIFVKKDGIPNFSFRRVGVYAGKIDKDIDKSSQSHYFIKFNDNYDIDEIYEKIKLLEFSGKMDTVGPKSISKQELIKELNKIT